MLFDFIKIFGMRIDYVNCLVQELFRFFNFFGIAAVMIYPDLLIDGAKQMSLIKADFLSELNDC